MAIDVAAQVRYWREGAVDDLEAAKALLAAAKFRQAGFFVHLAVEKSLKACVVHALATWRLEATICFFWPGALRFRSMMDNGCF